MTHGLIIIISFFFKKQSFLVETKENWGNIRQKNDREKENWWWREKHIHLVWSFGGFTEHRNPRPWIKEIAVNGSGSCPNFSEEICKLTLDRVSELTWFEPLIAWFLHCHIYQATWPLLDTSSKLFVRSIRSTSRGSSQLFLMLRRAWFAWNGLQSCSLFYPSNTIKAILNINA